MDSSTPFDGSLTSSETSYDYSKVTPEVWQEILSKIEDPHTFQSCAKTCRGWHKILQKYRTDQLFPLVLPHINDYISPQDILNCRRVSKRWKSGVENHLPLNPYWKHEQWEYFQINPDKEYWVSPLGNTFYTISQLRQFVNQMKNCSGNPFPTRTLLFYSIRYPLPSEAGARLQVQNMNKLFTALRSLLRKFGDQIWTFVYLTDHQDSSRLRSWLQQLFPLLPNLKKLHLDVHDCDTSGLQIFFEGWSWFKHLNPFPINLISLHVGPFFCSKVTGSILRAVGPQLQYLTCEGSVIEQAIYFGPRTRPQFVREMGNLRELNLTRTHRVRGQSETQLLERLARVHLPKLRKFSYAPDYSMREQPFPFTVILQLFNQFASEVEEFYVPFHRNQIREDVELQDGDLLQVPLPKLRTLGIDYTIVDHPSLEILLDKCPGLKTVKLLEFFPFGRRFDLERFGLMPNELQQILRLNGLIKSTSFQTIQLWVGGVSGTCVYTWKRN